MYNSELDTFLAVAEAGSFSKAAKKLYISQPSLTNAIHELEKEMNITMNDRLEFAHDENNPKEWFLHKTADKQGFPLQFNRGGTRLRNKYICKTILDIAKVKESATFLVSKDPVKTELGSFYRIILSCPILPKNKPKL